MGNEQAAPQAGVESYMVGEEWKSTLDMIT